MIIQKQELPNGELYEVVIIENADGSIISMPKAEYDCRQAEQSTPSLTDEAATI